MPKETKDTASLIQAKQKEIDAKQIEILSKELELNPLQGEMQALQNDLQGFNLQQRLESLKASETS